MYNCPQCGAGMRFDIGSQKLNCDYCGYTCAPDGHPQQMKDAQTAVYEATLYTCPKCGGEISSSDHAATDFCPYCGSSVVLNGRLSNEQKPDYIVPFRRTKETCRSAFENKAGKAWCVPNDFKNGGVFDKMMGIYLPYHIYDLKHDDRVYIDGTRTSGKYTEYCHIKFDLKTDYPWITADASSRLDDDIAYETGSCDRRAAVDFSTAYLCGFYADTPDVDSAVYHQAAEDCVKTDLYGQVSRRVRGLTGMRLDKTGYSPFQLKRGETKSALLPFWFLTWRKDNRIAYGIMNGNSGKLALDMPVDIRKFLLFSLLFAVPAAAVLYFLPVMTPATATSLALLIMIAVAVLYVKTVLRCSLRETHAADRGRGKEQTPSVLEKGQTVLSDLGFFKKIGDNLKIILLVVGFFAVFGVVPLLISGGPGVADLFVSIFVLFIIPLLTLAAAVMTFVFSVHAFRLMGRVSVLLESLPVTAAMVVPSVIIFMRPVNDEIYYGGLVLILTGAIVGMLFVIRRFNMLCTRPIPVFHERREVVQ